MTHPTTINELFTKSMNYTQLVHVAEAYGWDADPAVLLRQQFNDAELHGHSDTVNIDGRVYDYDWVVLSDPDWGNDNADYVVAYRYIERGSDEAHAYYVVVK